MMVISGRVARSKGNVVMSASKYNWAVIMHAGTRPQRYLKILDVVYAVTK